VSVRRLGRAVTWTVACGALLAAGVSACVEIGTGPTDAAAIELAPFASPSIVIGDSLRDINGALARITAIVRNIRGEEIADLPVRFLYADFPRDSALVVDSASGFVYAARVAKGEARIAARVGSTLQVLRPLIVTTRPDTMNVTGTVAELVTTLPDTARLNDNRNISEPLSVVVRHKEGDVLSGVNAWLVRFEVIYPANPTNDTTGAAFLVNTASRASMIDTTDNGGTASRRVRVRAALFPAGKARDSVAVRVTTSYRGVPVRGAPVTIVLPVRRDTTP
jgi:hypothetical protein